MRLLLHAGGSLASAIPDLARHFHGCQNVVFVAYAQADHDAATARWAAALAAHGVRVTGVHTAADPVMALRQADGIIIGGGNTFRLLKQMEDHSILDVIRERVEAGIPFAGASAGSNVAGSSIRTTNDMPIVQPRSFAALGLVPFQINPHYVDPPPPELRIGETREERLLQFLEENDVTVLGVREGAWLIVDGQRARLAGTAGAVVFQRGSSVREVAPGSDLSALLRLRPVFDVPQPPGRAL